MLEAETDNSSNENLFPDDNPEVSNWNNSALDRVAAPDRAMQTIDGQDHQRGTVSLVSWETTVAHASVASSKPKVEFHMQICV